MVEQELRNLIHQIQTRGCEEQTTEVMHQHGLSFDPIDFWFAMNLKYNDYHKKYNEDVEEYVKDAELFLDDIDAVEGKPYVYATKIMKR